jgi:hypothetical protein
MTQLLKYVQLHESLDCSKNYQVHLKAQRKNQLVALWRCTVARVTCNLYKLLFGVPWCNFESLPVASTASTTDK